MNNDEMLEAAANILVVCDLFDDIIRDAEAHDIDQAIVMRATCTEVIAKAKETIAALDTHLTSVMELHEPVVFKGVEYVVKRKAEQVRFDHGKIASRIQAEAIHLAADDDGVVSPYDAARQTAQLMRDVYLSDSSKAKIGELKRLGIRRSDVETKTLGDKYIDAVPLVAGDQEARDV